MKKILRQIKFSEKKIKFFTLQQFIQINLQIKIKNLQSELRNIELSFEGQKSSNLLHLNSRHKILNSELKGIIHRANRQRKKNFPKKMSSEQSRLLLLKNEALLIQAKLEEEKLVRPLIKSKTNTKFKKSPNLKKKMSKKVKYFLEEPFVDDSKKTLGGSSTWITTHSSVWPVRNR